MFVRCIDARHNLLSVGEIYTVTSSKTDDQGGKYYYLDEIDNGSVPLLTDLFEIASRFEVAALGKKRAFSLIGEAKKSITDLYFEYESVGELFEVEYKKDK